MIVCPVCEHSQVQGSVCDNCGKQLRAVVTDEPLVARLAELEVTPHAGGQVAVPVERVADLELTQVRSGPDLPAQSLPELDRHQIAQVGAVQVERVAELDLGREQDDGVRTQAPVGAVTCRYCRTVQASGLFCDSCGMRLPKVDRAAAAAAAARASDATAFVICGCGAKAVPGSRCGSCGGRVSAS